MPLSSRWISMSLLALAGVSLVTESADARGCRARYRRRCCCCQPAATAATATSNSTLTTNSTETGTSTPTVIVQTSTPQVVATKPATPPKTTAVQTPTTPVRTTPTTPARATVVKTTAKPVDTTASETLDYMTFSDAAGQFSILFPGTPKKVSQVVNGMTMNAFTYETHVNGKHLTLMVSYFDVPANLQIPGFVPSAKTYANATGGTLGATTDFTNDTYPGHLYRITAKNGGITRLGIVLAKRRMYNVIISASPTYAASEDAEKFLKSFKIGD